MADLWTTSPESPVTWKPFLKDPSGLETWIPEEGETLEIQGFLQEDTKLKQNNTLDVGNEMKKVP